jgi:CheY-like chemotaxis protein
MFGPPGGTSSQSLGQLTLEKLRADTIPVALLPKPTAVFNRTRGFSERVTQFVLSAEERTVLALVDGRTPLEDLALRSGVDLDVMVVAHRLAAVGLVTECDPRANARSSGSNTRPVMILEPDVEGFQRPLESLLANRAQPLPLLSLAAERDLVAAVRREHPRLVILNAQAAGEDVDRTARAIREERDLADVSLVAVLESPMATRRGELFAAGFDAVLVKPVAYTELERLLSA